MILINAYRKYKYKYLENSVHMDWDESTRIKKTLQIKLSSYSYAEDIKSWNVFTSNGSREEMNLELKVNIDKTQENFVYCLYDYRENKL